MAFENRAMVLDYVLSSIILCNVNNDFTTYEGGLQVHSLTVSSTHWQWAVSVLITAEFARGRWSRNLDPSFSPV